MVTASLSGLLAVLARSAKVARNRFVHVAAVAETQMPSCFKSEKPRAADLLRSVLRAVIGSI